MTEVEVFAEIAVVATPPTFAQVTPVRLLPVIVTLVPPLAGPELVERDVIATGVGLVTACS